MTQNKKVSNQDAEKVAEKSYQTEYYNSNDVTEKGLALTHEQVSDDYTEGTIDGKIDETDENGFLKESNGLEKDRGRFNE
ncbi:YozQ family protein [Evansella sp. LMS18]|jgi:hypothetical protein|uniref:YozQ family protein n=1 Tax=Evansella sp. LMS18 TaxID=2924033 RepID=UPI0020D0BFBD|nr:YozQ family protein [Evansella sp. LMS18]UTR11676.1 YozQ family protein [Evansella sp. LMS18]